MSQTTPKIAAEARTSRGSKASKALRVTGRMPAVLYGPNDAATPLTLVISEFEKVWAQAGESTVLTVTGLGADKDVLIQDVSMDPIYSIPTHADLYAIEKNKPVEVTVPLVFVGVAPAEKELGGTLIKVAHEIDIEALPKDLPHEIEVDISSLKTFDDQIHVADIKMPSGVTAVTDTEEVVALVQGAREEQEESAGTTDLSAIEVEKKGKEETEEEK